VQAITSSEQAGATASYAILVWPAGGTAKGIRVSISAKVSSAVSPRFSVCPAASGATCTVGTLPSGQAEELQAEVTVPTTATAGQHASLTATARASGNTISAVPASASVAVAQATTSTGSSGLGSGGLGTTLPAGTTPLFPVGVAASGAVPILPNPSTDPGGLFPTVGPSATPSPTAGSLPGAGGVRVTNVSNSVPLSTRLLGGQVLGLAVLAAALVIAIARLSLREPRTQHGKDPAP
jgi:hypothetical protein